MTAPRLRPDLGRALDTDRVAGSLARALADAGEVVRILQTGIVDVRYRPEGPCWILYKVRFRDREGRSHTLRVSGRLLDPGESPPPLDPGMAERYAASGPRCFRPPVLLLPDIPLAVYPFPVDSALRGLFEAISPERMKHHLGLLWSERRVRIRRVTIDVRGYTPEARAALSYRVLAQDRSTRIPEVRRLIGKMHAKKRASRIFADYWTLWSLSRGSLRIPPPVGVIAEAGLTLQEEVEGERLGGLVDRPGFLKHVRVAARMLAELHRLDAPLSSRRKADDEVRTVQRWAGLLGAIRPDVAARVEPLRRRLAAELERCVHPTAPIHADFHHTNVLVHGDELTFIDFDEAAIGDPMVDVGRFLASLRVPARRAFGSIGALDEAGGLFLEEYLARTGEDARRARLLEAASLLIAAGSSFRIQRAGWEEEVGLLVDECERVLALSADAAPAVPAAARKPDPETSRRWSRDPVYLLAALDGAVHERYGVHPVSCRIHTSSRTAVTCTLRGEREERPWELRLIGQQRTGGTRAFLSRLEVLHRAAGQNPESLQLPRPVAALPSLETVFWERPSGSGWPGGAGGRDLALAAGRVGTALASLQATPFDPGVSRAPDEDLDTLEKQLRSLAPWPPLAARARSLLSRVRESVESEPPPLVPCLRGLSPRDLVFENGSVGVERVEDVLLGHPAHDPSEFLARLQGANGDPSSLPGAIQAFREGLGSVADMPAFAGFEAAALLRRAASAARRGAVLAEVERWIRAAEACPVRGRQGHPA